MMASDDESGGVDVSTFFIRGRNALLARADFSGLYVDHYLHLAAIGERVSPEHDEMLKNGLAAIALHCASRPWNESYAWTVNFQKPLVNLFLAGDNNFANLIGRVHTEAVRESPTGMFFSDLLRGRESLRRSVVSFEGSDVFRAVEAFYAQSEQRLGRFFPLEGDEVAFISAQPDCDTEWLEGIDAEGVLALEETETLSPLERRTYQWRCGCDQERMMRVLESPMRHNADALFGDDESLRVHCPRCGMRHVITREALEAFLNAGEAAR